MALLALAISFLVLVLQIAAFVFTNFRNRHKDLGAKVDEAWFKAIILDDCLPELQQFCITQRKKLDDLVRGQHQTVAKHFEFLSQFNLASESLQRKLAMAECMSVKAMQATALEVEALGDAVVTNASKFLDSGNSAETREAALVAATQEFDKRSANCLSIWKRLHHALQLREDPDGSIAK